MKSKYFAGYWPWGGESGLMNNWAKYFLLALAGGEYPLWDPFHFWGCQDDYVILNYGQLNPFLYIALVFYKLGVFFPVAFFLYCIAYYGFGLLGFYCLAKLLLNNTVLAFWAYLLVLFSSLGSGWFMQHNIFLSLAPMPWFFYFLFQLIGTGQRKYILGLIFCLTLIATTYVPTYFVVTMTAFILACSLFCPAKLKSAVIRLWQIGLNHKRLIVFGIVTIAVCLAPRINWYLATQDDQYIFHVRSNPSADKHPGAVDIAGANFGGLQLEYSLPELFSDLDIGTIQFYYISIFVYLVILLSFWNRATNISKVVLFMFFFIFFYALTDVTPFHKFIFYTLPTAKFARNHFFLGSLLAAFLAVLAAEQIKQLWAVDPKGWKDKLKWTGYLAAVHLAALAYLLREDFIVISSYLTVLLSFCAFGALWLGGNGPRVQKIFLILVTAAILVQPLEVNYYDEQKKNLQLAPRPDPYPGPKFSYTRPKKDSYYLYWGFLDLSKSMQDLSGYADDYYYGVKWSYLLNKQVSKEAFAEYTQYKFFLYDEAVRVEEDSVDLAQVEKSLAEHKNRAYVFSFGPAQNILKNEDLPAKAQAVTEDSDSFKMLDFKLNSVRFMTDYQTPKFLVYNDSYHSSWRAFLNGAPVDLYRANFAFKGVLLPAGKNIVEFRYGPVWMPWLYTAIICYFMLFSCYTLKVFTERPGADI